MRYSRSGSLLHRIVLELRRTSLQVERPLDGTLSISLFCEFRQSKTSCA